VADDQRQDYAQFIREVRGNGHDPSDFSPLAFRNITAVLDAGDFVQGLLTKQSLVVVYGQSGSGKTFWTTTLALHVAAGREFAGRRIEQGGVVYCCMEGGIGFRNRVHAWREEAGLDDYDLPFWAITQHLNMRDDETVLTFITAVRQIAAQASLPIRLIVIDTLARALSGGNENAPDDMGALVMNADLMRSQTGACVLFVHHSGKNQALGSRGHSSLQAAVDTEIEVTENDDGTRSAAVLKQRDLNKGHTFPFTLKVIELGLNPYSEPVTTCLVQLTETTASPAKLAKRHRGISPAGQICLRALNNTLGKTGSFLPPTNDYPPNTVAVAINEWKAETFSLKAASDDLNTKTFNRGQDNLLANSIITQRNGFVWIVARTDQDR
jgi:hypothetical protein